MKYIALLCTAAVLSASAIASADNAPRTVITKSGERVTGSVISRSEKEIVIDSATMGTVAVSAANVDQVVGPDGKAEPYTPVADPGLWGTGLLSGWKRSLEAGVSGVEGTTDSVSLNAMFNANVDNDEYLASFGAWYFLTSDNNGTSRNQTRVFGDYGKKIDGGPWFIWGRGQYDNDSLALWENRVSGFAGPGYEFIKKDTYELTGRAGLGYTHEFGGNTPDGYDDSRFEALIGVDGKWIIDANQSLVYSSYYYPSLENFSYGRVISTIGYLADLSKKDGLAFHAGMEHDYDFITPGDDDHNNWKYFANIVLKM